MITIDVKGQLNENQEENGKSHPEDGWDQSIR